MSIARLCIAAFVWSAPVLRHVCIVAYVKRILNNFACARKKSRIPDLMHKREIYRHWLENVV